MVINSVTKYRAQTCDLLLASLFLLIELTEQVLLNYSLITYNNYDFYLLVKQVPIHSII